jgi:hypothetical protein
MAQNENFAAIISCSFRMTCRHTVVLAGLLLMEDGQVRHGLWPFI